MGTLQNSFSSSDSVNTKQHQYKILINHIAWLIYKNKALSDEWHLNSNYQSLRSSKRQSSQVGICWRWRVSEPISYQIWYNSLARSKAELLCKATGSCGCKLWERKNEILGFNDQLCAMRTNFKRFFVSYFYSSKRCSEMIFFHFDLLTPCVLASSMGTFFGALHILNVIFSVYIYFFLITSLLSSILLTFFNGSFRSKLFALSD